MVTTKNARQTMVGAIPTVTVSIASNRRQSFFQSRNQPMSSQQQQQKSALEILLSQAFLEVTEIAAVLRCSKMTVYEKLKNGDIEGVKEGRRWKIPRANFLVYLEKTYGPGTGSA